MRKAFLFVLSTALAGSSALAQSAPPSSDPSDNPAANSAVTKPTTPAPAQPQPQGQAGPTDTTSGGAPASSPQGDTPPGMQPDPHDPKQGADRKK
jgi:hypothetical protein